MSLSIHPAIGIARVGDSSDPNRGFYVGPERGGALPSEPDGAPLQGFRDAGGGLRRQAARFRIFGADGRTEVRIGERLGDKTVTDIVWTVHIANKKASFYEFHQLQGEQGYHQAVIKGKTVPYPLRNAGADDRASLVIDPGPRTVDGDAPRAHFTAEQAGDYPASFPPPLQPHSIHTLGELQREDDGNLLVLGGLGRSGTTGEVTLPTYANNDGWFDDVGDGPVSAVVRFDDGSNEAAVGAWVVVTPPAYAPEVVNQVTLYDVLFDLFVRTADGFGDAICAGGTFDPSYAPSFPDAIRPVLERANGYAWVATRCIDEDKQDGESFNTYTSRVQRAPHDFHTVSADSTLTARFLNDLLRADGDFNRPWQPQTTTPAMPFVCGDNPIDDTEVRKFLTLTPTQLFILRQWQAGKATDDPGEPLTPAQQLDRGVLDNCTGGPFCPGIEGGWVFRDPRLYDTPFRIKRKQTPDGLTFNPVVGHGSEPGDLTQRMAIPWQADFNECSYQQVSVAEADRNTAEDGTTVPPPLYYTLWWPAQRPMAVFTEAGRGSAALWARDSQGAPLSDVDMAKHWSKLGFVMNVGQGAPDFVEVERSPVVFSTGGSAT